MGLRNHHDRDGDPMKVETWTSSDYAGMNAGPWRFYYGYEWGHAAENESDEYDRPEKWGFIATHETRGVVLSLPFEGLTKCATNRLGKFAVEECLMAGIGLVACGMTGTPK